MTSVSTDSRRRGDIEGMRALAVVVVVAYHCGLTGFSGGFVGVDVFFALSGYLMTGLLLAEHERSGTIGLRAFYARRIRRLLPASALVTAVTLAVGWFVLDPLALRRLAGDAVGVATYTVNMRFAVQGSDYLQADAAISPLLHHWSLAVEEQFYLVWPVLLLVAAGRRTGAMRRVALTLGVLAIVSFTLSVVQLHDAPVWTFYGLHTRAWEFAVGGLALIVGRALGEGHREIRALTGWAGLALVLLTVVVYDDLTPFPGWSALPPVVGTLLVLDTVGAPGAPSRLLGARPLVWIGGRSYSIYLWHWPPLVLLPAALDRSLSVPEALATVAAASVLAVAVHRFVEDPIRYARPLVARPSRNYALAASLAAVTILLAGALWASADLTGDGVAAEEPTLDVVDGTVVIAELEPVTAPEGSGPPATASVPTPRPAPSNLTPSLATVEDDEPVLYAAGCHGDYAMVEPLDCVYGDLTAGRTMALFGDSHAAQWFPGLEEVALDGGWRLEPYTKSGCPSVSVSVFNVGLGRDYTECDAWRDAVLTRLEADPPELVVVANLTGHTLADGTDSDDPAALAAWETGLGTTLSRLEATGTRIVLITTLPSPRTDAPRCVASHLDDVTACDTPRGRAVDRAHTALDVAAAREHGATLLRPVDWVCGPDVCPAVIGKFLVYRDRSHITTDYSRWLAPVLAGTGAFD